MLVCFNVQQNTHYFEKIVTDRSGHGRREGPVVHVGRVVHVAHHDVTWIARVWMAFTVQVLQFCC